MLVSIQLISPASGDSLRLKYPVGTKGNVSIQLISPASGDSVAVSPSSRSPSPRVSIQLISPASGDSSTGNGMGTGF